MPAAGAIWRTVAAPILNEDKRMTETFSATDIEREHPEYSAKSHLWRKYRDLYVGGDTFLEHADRYLVRRHKEGGELYAERLCRAFYENYAGSIVDWYSATLFRREPVILFEGKNDRGKLFYNEFTEDCDLKGTQFAELFRKQFVEMLICGRSHIVVDFPCVTHSVESRAQEDAAGKSRAYLVAYSADDLINWSRDPQGNYEWVVLRTTGLRKEAIDESQWTKHTRWVYYDKTRFRIYERLEKSGTQPETELIAEGIHGLAKQQRVPLFDMEVAEGMWLLNKAASLQLEHFNKSNALGWALTMGLFAMPVIYSERDWNQILGESYYIQLGPQDRFGWTEPQGAVYQIATDNLTRLQEEIYRVCHLTQAGGGLSGGGMQSGLSKQRDFAITNEVLRAYGDAVKETMKRVLRAIEAAREDDLAIGVTGIDEFDIGDFGTELADAQQLLAMGIDSPTLKKQVFQKLALKYLCDARQEVKEQIAKEIEGGV
jgi:hypothetical protein